MALRRKSDISIITLSSIIAPVPEYSLWLKGFGPWEEIFPDQPEVLVITHHPRHVNIHFIVLLLVITRAEAHIEDL